MVESRAESTPLGVVEQQNILEKNTRSDRFAQLWRPLLAEVSFTFCTFITCGRKEEVVSSVIRGRGRGGACWGSSGGLLSPAPPLLSSSPTRCLCRSLYGALKFLIKASNRGGDKQNSNFAFGSSKCQHLRVQRFLPRDSVRLDAGLRRRT